MHSAGLEAQRDVVANPLCKRISPQPQLAVMSFHAAAEAATSTNRNTPLRPAPAR